jgi:hypothetical protein
MAGKTFYKHKRYWYHVSTTLKDKYINMVPWDDGFNRSSSESTGKRICVSPSIEQCIAAIPYILSQYCNIYRTRKPIVASEPKGIFDSKVTHEGWLHEPTDFVKIGMLKFSDVEKTLGIEQVIGEAASSNDPRQVGKVLKWWKNARIKRIIKKA